MKALTTLLAILLVAALVGCGTKEETTPAPAPAPEPTSWWDGLFGQPEEPVVVETEPTSWWDGLFGEPEPAPEPAVEPSWLDRVFGDDSVAAK